MSRDVLTSGKKDVLVAPSILSADFAELGAECEHALGEGGAELLHIDVMDGHFVPNLTMGPAIVKSLRKRLPEACLDVHVMVTDPGQYIEPFADAGADHLTFHLEPARDVRSGAGMSPLSAGYDVRQMAGRVRASGMSAGLAINPPTPIEPALDVVEAFDLVLMMSVNPGFSGQAFIEESLEKATRLREVMRPEQRLQMDGGVSPANAEQVRASGVDVLVAATAIFGEEKADRKAAIDAIRGA